MAAGQGSDVTGRQVLKILATLAFVLPPLGPLPSVPNVGSLLGVGVVAIAGIAALVYAWRRPLPGGILVALLGAVPFVVELLLDAAGAGDPASRYWLFWFFPGSLVGGALFVAASFWRAPRPSPAAPEKPPAGSTGGGLVRRMRREAVGLAVLVVVGLVFLAVLAWYPREPNTDALLPGAIILVGWPLFLVGAGVVGYRLDRGRGSFVGGLVAAAVAMVGMGVALAMAGQPLLRVGEGEWIGEAWLAAGLAIVGGGFLGLLGGGIAALAGGASHRNAHP